MLNNSLEMWKILKLNNSWYYKLIEWKYITVSQVSTFFKYKRLFIVSYAKMKLFFICSFKLIISFDCLKYMTEVDDYY